MELSWWSIEARDGAFSAHAWINAYAGALVEAAITNGAREWRWDSTGSGVVLEIGFVDEEGWQRFRSLPAVVAALDAVPADLLYVYPGRGGTSGAPLRRRPKPTLGSGAATIPEEAPPVIVARPNPVDYLIAS